MKRLTINLLMSIVAATGTHAQIPNGRLELWENYHDPANPANMYQKPNGWVGMLPKSPSSYSFSIEKNPESYPLGTGQYSMLIKPDTVRGVDGVSFSYDAFPNGMAWPNIPPSFPIAYRPTSLCLYYKYLPAYGDTMGVGCIFYKNGVVIGNPSYGSAQSVSNWSLLVIPMTYYNSEVPDSATMILSCFPRTQHNGSKLFVDSIRFDTPITSVGEAKYGDLPRSFGLLQNYPNPFNPTTVAGYQLPVASDVRLVVYDMLGREVAVLVNQRKAPGTHTVTIDPRGFASRVYLYSLTAGNYVQTQKVILVGYGEGAGA